MFDQDTLQDYKGRGLIKSSEKDGYTVWCYTQQAVVERAWDDVTRACRGLVLAPDGSLVSRPFQKFHNWGEPEAVIERGPFLAFDKMDGTLIVVGNHIDSAIVSTKGSFTTWHSEAARELLLGFVPPPGQTALFELIHPENRIVVDYGDYTGLVFLGGVDNETGADLGRPDEVGLDMGWHGDIVVQRSFNLKSMLNTIQNPEAGPNREGFVVVWPRENAPWNRVKLKFALYVQLHGIYTGLTNRRVWECLVTDSLGELLDIAPDELHADIGDVAAAIMEEADVMLREASDVVALAQTLPNRKEQAEMIIDRLDRPVSALAFKMLDGKDDEARLIAIGAARPEVSKFVGSAGLS
jgi:RNA ligase